MKKCVLLILLGFVFLINGICLASNEQPLVNLLLFETDIREALSEITMQTGVNIIPDSTVSGVITADLHDVPLEKALRMILISGGFTYKKLDEDFYFIGLPDPRSTTFGELADSHVVKLTHVTVDKVLSVLPDFLDSYVQGNPDGTVMTITAPPAEIERILQLIAQVDMPEEQVEIQVLVTEVTTEFMRNIGSELFSYTYQAGQGINTDWQGEIGWDVANLILGFDIYGQLLTHLRLAEQNQEAKIYADPKIVVADGKSAELFIGDKQILVISGVSETSTRIERVEVGISLTVTPRIFGDKVTLDIAPEISHFVNEAKPDLIVKNSSVSTTVVLGNGQTAMLAGMTMQETNDYSKKVPILGDIPLIRWFFRSDVQKEADTELLIFVTPIIQ